ncbi:aminotransferase class I/II-fold pyridoxal phosphate-dependent enzyme [Algivirga pacifica]|uniref:7-keto-8-aminopelargonate synthetase n=1 Tax=Algivirga pacifica TaxID=1162670 RepID=A0ABP9D5Q1_9BACT
MSNTLDTLHRLIEHGYTNQMVHNYTQDQILEGDSQVTIAGEEMTNFGSCSYLGLEHEETLKQGVIDAVTRYGTQFSSSRTYLSLGLYQELEMNLEAIFRKPVIVSASTTLGHLATLPVIVGENDAVILDMQAHSSMQMTAQQLKAKRITTSVIRHNCMESLEKKIKLLSNKHDKVWYLADGVYSMYGDKAAFEEIEKLLNRYKKFHLYIDDAHGMGWEGENGMGVVRHHMAHHDKMVLAVSLNKSFGTAGGCIVFPNEMMARKVRNCGATYIFCGPIQPPMLGAACASARLHLSDELPERQKYLKELIAYTNQRLKELSLPQYLEADTPIFFIPVGLPDPTMSVIKKMKDDGFYMNSASFPAVPIKKGGVRFMVNSRLTKEDINQMLMRLQVNYLKTLNEIGSSCEEVSKVFGISEFSISIEETSPIQEGRVETLNTRLFHSIHEIKKESWNQYFKGNGNLDYDNITLLEETFTNQALPENNWDFHYFVVTDNQGEVVLKTFYTSAISKEDMFSPKHVSEKVEAERVMDPYYLTSQNILTGTLITKGSQVYLNQSHKDWKQALKLLVEQMQSSLQDKGATKMMLRDFFGEKIDQELEDVMMELGLVRYQLLNNYVVTDLNWKTTDDFLGQLGQKYRYNVRKEILRYEHMFSLSYDRPESEEELLHLYELYIKVFERALDLNVFQLPFDYFKAMCQNPNYDIIKMYLKPEQAGTEFPQLVGVMFSYVNEDLYNAMIVGLDYAYVRSHNTYKQILYQTLLRAKQLGCHTLDLAYTAELEKKKLGATAQEVYAYVQAADHYNFSVLESMN